MATSPDPRGVCRRGLGGQREKNFGPGVRNETLCFGKVSFLPLQRGEMREIGFFGHFLGFLGFFGIFCDFWHFWGFLFRNPEVSTSGGYF